MSETINQEVAELISKATKIPVDKIKPDSSFEALGMDSLDATTLLFELEETYDVRISNEEAKKLVNLDQVVKLLKKLGINDNQR